MHYTLTRTCAAIISLTLPFSAVAAGLLQAQDSIAGLGLNIKVGNSPPSSPYDILVIDPDEERTTVQVKTDASGHATIVIPGIKTETAGVYQISALQNRQVVLGPITARVDADSMDGRTSSIQTRTPYIKADGHDEAEISVQLRDRFGNPLSGRPVALISGRSDDNIQSLTPETDEKGIQYFTLSTDIPGNIQLRAIDLLSGNTITESANITAEGGIGGHETYTSQAGGKRFYENTSPYRAQVTSRSFDILDHFEVIAPEQMNASEEAQKITIRAVDRNGNVVEDYIGSIRFITTDPDATVPNFGTYEFKARDLGEKSFALALKFRTTGLQTLRVEDANDARIFGEADVQVIGGSAGSTARGIEITSHRDGDYVNSLEILVTGRGPRLANLILMGGEQDTYGATDDMGDFSIPVILNANQRDFTLRIRDDAGRNDSGSIHLILDQVKPEIGAIQFAPENPEEGEKVLAVVESEPNLGRMILRLPDPVNSNVQEIILAENSTQSGSYQAFFTAPVSGTYQPSITAMDKAGNIEEVRTQLLVGGKNLPQVQNLKAEPRVDAVELSWDPLPGELSGYRIYIGDSPTNFLYTLDTGRVITKATVKGLTPGQTYVFAVTALRDDSESMEKSATVTSTVLGFTLDITPEDGALNVQWTSLTSDLPLSSFTLEYGIDANTLTETRLLNGGLRNYTIRDLLNGVTYFVKVTPVTVTGDTLEELEATGEGTPNGNGFNPSARDDIPFDASTLPGGTTHPAPSNPSTGIPPLAWMFAASIGVLGVLYRWKKRKAILQTQEFMKAVQASYRR